MTNSDLQRAVEWRLTMRLVVVLLSFCGSVVAVEPVTPCCDTKSVAMATCTGSASCRACKSCSSCGHCKRGGSCGVCARPAPTPAPVKTPEPRPTTAPQPSTPKTSTRGQYEVARVIDGDTIEVTADGKPLTVRLIGVDTPETVHPSKPIEHYGKEASVFLRNLLLGESVTLTPDQGDVLTTDKYGRTLAYVHRAPDELFVNLEIVRQGYGHAYTQYPFKHMELFKAFERLARETGKGLWATDK